MHTHKLFARRKKATLIAHAIEQTAARAGLDLFAVAGYDTLLDIVAGWGDEEWRSAGLHAGVRPPSEREHATRGVSPDTRLEVLGVLGQHRSYADHDPFARCAS